MEFGLHGNFNRRFVYTLKERGSANRGGIPTDSVEALSNRDVADTIRPYRDRLYVCVSQLIAACARSGVMGVSIKKV